MQIPVSMRNQARTPNVTGKRITAPRPTPPSRGQAASLYEGGEGRRADGSLLRPNTFLGLRAARACARELEAVPLHLTLF